MNIETHRELLNEIARLKRRCDLLEAAMDRVLGVLPSAAPIVDVNNFDSLVDAREIASAGLPADEFIEMDTAQNWSGAKPMVDS